MTLSDRWLIHRHIARQTDERLAIVTRTPQHILLVGADADESRSLLAARYPKAAFSEYDPRADFLQAAASGRKSGLLAKLTGKTVAQHRQALENPLPQACCDMLWANLSLILAEEPTQIFDNWANALQTDGLLFFTHFGIDSLQDLRRLLAEQGIRSEVPRLFDMHDLGDMLFHHGFYDPVMDTAKLELDYRSADAFWQDMETLGLWASLRFDDEAAARQAVNTLFAEQRLNRIVVETVFGHEVKKLQLPEGESQVQFFAKRPG